MCLGIYGLSVDLLRFSLFSLYLNSVPPHSGSPENSKCLLLYYLIPLISQATTSSLKHFLYLASRTLYSPHFLPSRLHSFSVSFTGSFSSSSLLNIGVSQDSDFRPLFCLYSLLNDVIQFNGFKYPLPTNNSRIYVVCPDLQNHMPNCLLNIFNQMLDMHLKLNLSKTTFDVPPKLVPRLVVSISINDSSILRLAQPQTLESSLTLVFLSNLTLTW